MELRSPLRLATLLAALLVPATSGAVTFSLDAGSISIGPVGPADLLTAGPVGGPPAIVHTAGSLGLGPGDDIDALSFGPFTNHFPYFSIDDLSPGGVPGSASSVEAAAGQAAGDIYVDMLAVPPPGGTNALFANQDVLGELPAIPPGVPNAAFPIDDLDALDMDSPALIGPGTPIFFSLTPGSPTLGALLATPADILVTTVGGAPAVFMPMGALGLVAGDDIDAFVVDPAPPPFGPPAFFSLAPGSPSLGTWFLTPADVVPPLLGPPPAGPPGPPPVFGPSPGSVTTLGLTGADNVDAFSDSPVPLPPGLVLLASALAGLACVRRSRRTG